MSDQNWEPCVYVSIEDYSRLRRWRALAWWFFRTHLRWLWRQRYEVDIGLRDQEEAED